jgi:KDO2-lipid IV(A) lauroyltransferase
LRTYYLLRSGALIARLVPLGLLYALAAALARVAYLVPSPAREAVRGNIAQATGLPPRSRAVRRGAATAFRCQALNYIDLLRLDRLTVREMDASVVHGDLAPLYEAMALGKGAVILAAHVGNVDFVGQWLALHGFTIHSVMEHLQPERLFNLVTAQRSAVGLQMHVAEPSVMGTLTDVLRAGGVVALVADRDLGGHGEQVEFFGRPTRLPVGPALLSLRTGAPLVPAYGLRLPDNRMYVTVRPPVELVRSRDLRSDLHEGLKRMARSLEECISVAPEQWIVFEPLWKDLAA